MYRSVVWCDYCSCRGPSFDLTSLALTCSDFDSVHRTESRVQDPLVKKRFDLFLFFVMKYSVLPGSLFGYFYRRIYCLFILLSTSILFFMLFKCFTLHNATSIALLTFYKSRIICLCFKPNSTTTSKNNCAAPYVTSQ